MQQPAVRLPKEHSPEVHSPGFFSPGFLSSSLIIPIFLAIVSCFVFSSVPVISSEPEVVERWSFDRPGDRQGWDSVNHLTNIQVADGLFQATITNRDPFIINSTVSIPARPWNVFRARVRIVQDTPLIQKTGELFYANDNSGPYGGFSQDKTGKWSLEKANQWQTIEIYPFWDKLSRIIKLRFDFPVLEEKQFNKGRLEIDWIEIVDLKLDSLPTHNSQWEMADPAAKLADSWSSGLLTLQTAQTSWLSANMTVEPPTQPSADPNQAEADTTTAVFEWLNEKGTYVQKTFPVHADGNSHQYNIPLDSRFFNGQVHGFKLSILPAVDSGISGQSDSPTSNRLAVTAFQISTQPQGPAQMEVLFSGIEDAMVRAGYDTAFFIDAANYGGKPTGEITIKVISLPEGLKITSAPLPKFESLEPSARKRLLIPMTATAVCEGTIELTLVGTGAPEKSLRIPVSVLPSLNLEKQSYVPEPKPLKSDYEIGALYFPGWYQGHSWSRIWNRCPERRPLLGWYNESSPEVIDWQIKWSVENGISFYLVDWYWSKGNRSLEHWVKGFQKAKYRSYLKWAMMWANHNGPGSHSIEDQTAVTRYWLENYFNTPEYYCIDGRPVVMIWSPEGMDRDMIASEARQGRTLTKGQGVKMLLDQSQLIAREAGLKGIYFVAMKWPEASTRAEDIQWLADAGFEMTSIYHFMDDGGKAATRKKFSFDLVVEASKPYWQRRLDTGVLPFLPNLATGWDDRPWNDHCWIADRTPEKFGEICRQFKDFADQTGVKRAVLAPVNEWGEGSYAEPCREFGFRMYEAVRENLCEKPEDGWPLNYGPKDIGLGPYEYTGE